MEIIWGLFSFEAEAVDNVFPDGDADVEIFAKVPGYDFKPLLISVLDDDMPEISLLLSSKGVAENDGRHAVTGIVTRSNNTDSKIVVRLTDEAPGQLEYSSSTIVMPKGVESMEFTFGPVDNTLSDGDREIIVTAGVYLSGCLCTPPLTARAGVAYSSITITDDDGPILTLSGPSSIAEDGKG